MSEECEKLVEQAGRVCNERTLVEVINEFEVVNGVGTAIGEDCWWEVCWNRRLC